MRSSLRPLVGAVFLLVLQPGAAHASMFGEENISLAALVVQASEQVTALQQQLQIATQTYNETRKYVGMLADAKQAFTDIQSFGTAILSKPDEAFANLMPDAAYLRYQLTSPQNWAQGTGELQARVRMCFATGAGPDACAEFYQAVKAEQAKRAMQQTFGVGPKGQAGEAIDVVDTEAARAIADSTAAAGDSAKRIAQARALRERCQRDTGPDGIAACQALAAEAAFVQLEETAALNQQMAEANRLKALELAEKNGQRKRELLEAEARRKAISDGFHDMQDARLGAPGAVTAPLESPLLPKGDAP
jgi:hypothetical protein